MHKKDDKKQWIFLIYGWGKGEADRLEAGMVKNMPLPARLDGCCIRCVGTDHHRADTVSDASVS